MLSKTKIAYLRSLHRSKDRKEAGRFIVEGKKSILEVANSHFRIVEGFLRENFLHPLSCTFPVELISDADLARISSLTSNRDGIVVVEMPPAIPPKIPKNTFTLVLDGINDPGNLGTIIRIADWYGIKHIIASEDTVDIYNPKTIMATMGSFSRVAVHYVNVPEFLSENTKMPVYGAFLEGENLHAMQHIAPGYIVIGSEAHGIRPEVATYISHKITIPRFGGAESLNAGVATGIIVDRMIGKK